MHETGAPLVTRCIATNLTALTSSVRFLQKCRPRCQSIRGPTCTGPLGLRLISLGATASVPNPACMVAIDESERAGIAVTEGTYELLVTMEEHLPLPHRFGVSEGTEIRAPLTYRRIVEY